MFEDIYPYFSNEKVVKNINFACIVLAPLLAGWFLGRYTGKNRYAHVPVMTGLFVFGTITLFLRLYFYDELKFIELLKILLGWPAVTALIIVSMGYHFRNEIRDLIDRIQEGQVGNVALKFQQRAPSPTRLSSPVIANTPQKPDSLSPADVWEFRYLHLYLVTGTQIVLDFIARAGDSGISYDLYSQYFEPHIPDPVHRENSALALQAHGLITFENSIMKITDRGLIYQKFRGPLPDELNLERTMNKSSVI